jgi:hypothetical protein
MSCGSNSEQNNKKSTNLNSNMKKTKKRTNKESATRTLESVNESNLIDLSLNPEKCSMEEFDFQETSMASKSLKKDQQEIFEMLKRNDELYR